MIPIKFSQEAQACYETAAGTHWYGGGEQYQQPWPLEEVEREDYPFVTGDMLQNAVTYYGGIVERYFLNSGGVAVFVDPNVSSILYDSRLC